MYYTKYDETRLSGRYLQISNKLLNNAAMTLEEVMIYSIIMSRLNLSKLKSTCDKDGSLFVTLTNAQVQTFCRCGHDKATQILKSLEEKGLIERKKSYGAADRIFPLKQNGGLTKEESKDGESDGESKDWNAFDKFAKTWTASKKPVDVSASDFEDCDEEEAQY